MESIQAQSVALPRNYDSKPSKVLSALGHRVLADRDFTVVATFVIIGLLLSFCLMLFCPSLEEVSVVLSTLS
jgi:hypothetical protein